MSAIKLAINDGADYVEIDVQETADGEIVVLHDDDLMRVAGKPWKIWETKFADLRGLDTGSWFSEEFADERIPTLREVIEVCRGRIRLNIELKYNGHDEQLAERVVEIIHDESFTDECVVTSLEASGIQRVRQLDPAIHVGMIVTVSLGDLTRLDVEILSVNHKKVSRSLLANAHLAGKEVHVWTVNDRQRMTEMVESGVDNILTDDPRVLAALLEERAKMSTTERLLYALRHRLAE
jgi:glycerophosphoryl diester phosphodiesterase